MIFIWQYQRISRRHDCRVADTRTTDPHIAAFVGLIQKRDEKDAEKKKRNRKEEKKQRLPRLPRKVVQEHCEFGSQHVTAIRLHSAFELSAGETDPPHTTIERSDQLEHNIALFTEAHARNHGPC